MRWTRIEPRTTTCKAINYANHYTTSANKNDFQYDNSVGFRVGRQGIRAADNCEVFISF